MFANKKETQDITEEIIEKVRNLDRQQKAKNESQETIDSVIDVLEDMVDIPRDQIEDLALDVIEQRKREALKNDISSKKGIRKNLIAMTLIIFPSLYCLSTARESVNFAVGDFIALWIVVILFPLCLIGVPVAIIRRGKKKFTKGVYIVWWILFAFIHLILTIPSN
ncbi:hypothetical protein MSL71_48110 [Desulfoluna butyratoxydans]|uniref:Uncharacterized protein n=2 Tax=Desulfoluna butyratoxydans TaxID=231438 RepID=A0A4U8YRW4_9BACT|nr:hypothetical protein MSL71_48110 [Desulfoluna butyratoxydans]